ncbi:hypothetical protein ABFY43_20475, partial [Bacillus pumilus]|uniref:hypothetical protein n=1 Tax=Bacillus pumilus TaxID=1408 RepID=UPI003D1C0CA6
MTEIIINLPVLVTAIFLIVFVLLHKKIEKKTRFNNSDLSRINHILSEPQNGLDNSIPTCF